MSVKKRDDGSYKVDIRPNGRYGRRIQRLFKKKADALAFERYVLSHMNDKEWLEKPADHRRISELLELWWKLGGRNKPYADNVKLRLKKVIKEMGDPRVEQINARFMAMYRSERLGAGVKISTIQRDEAELAGMFTMLIQSGEFHSKNPVRSVPAMKRKISEMTYLTHEEIIRLLNFSNGDARRITLLCLSTGARWGEAKSLRAEHIIDNRVIFNKTKNGKVRIVPVSNEVVREIKTKDSGMLFDVDYGEYRKMLRAVKPDLPKGQAVHVLRHTFATHFMMNGGSIIALQRVLGHANIQQTMIYAHFAPDYLSDVLKFNPVANANIAKEKEPAE